MPSSQIRFMVILLLMEWSSMSRVCAFDMNERAGMAPAFGAVKYHAPSTL